MNRPLLLLSFFALLAAGCGKIEPKYVEGPLVSPFPASDRVTNTWEWAYHWDSGVNLSGEYKDSTLQITADNVVKICGEGDACREGTWRLISKKKRLQFIFDEKATAYDIDMLKKNEMWLSFKNADSVNTVIWQLVSVEEGD